MTTTPAYRIEQPPAPADTWWGKRTLVDLSGCDPAVLHDGPKQKRMILALTELIGMKAYGESDANWFGEGNKEGWTIRVLLTTSNAEWHTTEAGDVYANVFSCRDYDPEVVAAFLSSAFHAAKANVQVIYHHSPGVDQP